MGQWLPYKEAYAGDGHSVSGDIQVLRGVAAYGLAPRDLLVYLPPSYASDPMRRYPVLYLQDGQNVFDAATSYAGEWGADEAAEDLAAHGYETILVAIPNAGKARLVEYSPWPVRPFPFRGGTKASAYCDFLLHTVKPLIDAAFRTSRERAETGIAGSSLGGLIALYACLTRPGAFGFCAALSPALWPGRGRIFEVARERRGHGTRVYLDAGGREVNGRLLAQAQRMSDTLARQGYDVAYVEDADADHNEAAWRRRFPAVLAWFLDPALRPDADGVTT